MPPQGRTHRDPYPYPSFSLDQTTPHFGDSATFTVTDRTAQPYATVTCYQAGVRVVCDTKHMWAGAFNPQPFYFSSNDHHRTLATLTFSVLP